VNLLSFSSTAACLLAVGVCLQTAHAENWTDVTGKHTIDAKFVRLAGDKVQLQKTDGTVISVPLSKLSVQSRQMAQKLGVKPAGEMTAEQTVKTMRVAMANGEVDAVWKKMPPTYKKDINGLLHEFARNMDADVWKDIVEVADTAVAVLKKQKQFILQQPQVADGIKDEKAVSATWDELVGALEIVTSSDIMDLDKMKQMDLGVFIDTTGKKLGAKLTVLGKLGDQIKAPEGAKGLPGAEVLELENVVITTLKQGSDTATLRFTTPATIEGEEDKVEDTEFVKFEGVWLPKERVESWDADMASAKKTLGEMKQQLPLAQIFLAPVKQYLKKLENAKTKEEFNAVIGEIAGALIPKEQDFDFPQ